MSRRVVIGVDSSTQSCKVEARDLDSGEVLAFASAPHPPTTPPVSEHDPHVWWEALSAALAQIAADHPDVMADVAAMSVAGQQHGLVLTDAEGAALLPAKLWNDTTSAPNADRLVEHTEPEQWARLAGSVPVAAFTIAKLAWVVEHRPDVIERVGMVMLPHDYLTWRLTGAHVTDRGDASGTGWFQPSTDAYEPGLLDAAGVEGERWLDLLPRVLGWREPAGHLRPDIAEQFGMTPDVVVAPGTGDNMAAALGVGLAAGDVVVSLGTSGTAYARSATPTHDASAAVAGFASATGDYLPLVCTLNATKVSDTVATWLGVDPSELARLALTAIEDPGSAVLVPYFDGERTPNRPDATGSIVGLTNTTTREQLALAVHDAVLCGLLDGVDALAAAGASVDGRLRLVGGGARSQAYRQRLADLTSSVIIVPTVTEAVATGAAAQAAMTLELCDPAEITARWGTDAGTEIEPKVDARNRRDRYDLATHDDP